MSERKGAILRQSFGFAVRVVNLYKYLVTEKREFVLSKQLLRSGTAVGALVREAQMQKAKQISFINSELLRRNVMRAFIGLNFWWKPNSLKPKNLKA